MTIKKGKAQGRPKKGYLCEFAPLCPEFQKAVIRKRLDELQAEIARKERRGEGEMAVAILYEKQALVKRIIEFEGIEKIKELKREAGMT